MSESHHYRCCQLIIANCVPCVNVPAECCIQHSVRLVWLTIKTGHGALAALSGESIELMENDIRDHLQSSVIKRWILITFQILQ